MYINNNYNKQPSFKCIKIEKGGIELLKKEGTYAISKVEQVKDEFKQYKWHLNINPDSYSLTSPTTKKTYKGPFTIKRRIKKNINKPDEYKLIIRMNNNNREKFSVKFDSIEEVQKTYKSVKTSNGIDKMIKLLEILEKGLKLNTLKIKIAQYASYINN